MKKIHFWLAVCLIAGLLLIIFGCATYQVMDGRKVPRHPRPDSAAVFPMRQR